MAFGYDLIEADQLVTPCPDLIPRLLCALQLLRAPTILS
jgi:hypothetical protein